MISKQNLPPIFDAYKENNKYLTDEQTNKVYNKAIKIMDHYGANILSALVNFKENSNNDLYYDIYNCLHQVYHTLNINYLPLYIPPFLPNKTRNSRLLKEIFFRLIYYLCIKKTDKDLKLMIKLSNILWDENYIPKELKDPLKKNFFLFYFMLDPTILKPKCVPYPLRPLFYRHHYSKLFYLLPLSKYHDFHFL